LGLFSGLLGNASEIDIRAIEQEFSIILTATEQINKVFKVIRDLIVFTNKRLILVDKQGVTGKKVEYHSIPYKSISHFSIESAGHFDLDAELKIWVSGIHEPISKQFKKDKSIFDVQKELAKHL
jgi:hypothetical protein